MTLNLVTFVLEVARMKKLQYIRIFCLFTFLQLQAFISVSNAENSAAPVFSHQRGFYETAFTLEIRTNPDGGTIKYTLDGSNPLYSGTAIVKTSPVTINVNPETETGNRGPNPGFVVRACAQNSGLEYSTVVTHTYLFAKRVKNLSPDNQSPGPGWPTSSPTGQRFDYGMDPNILNDNLYKDLIDAALVDIPSVSLVTDLTNLFDPGTGIFVNAQQHGEEWERPCSVELLNPDGSKGFQINAGVRIRGGWHRNPDNPKRAFRLFFRQEYGEGKLKYSLFGDEGASEFDKFDLRTSQNYAWSMYDYWGQYNTMNRDVFSRDLQQEMDEPYTRSRYYHLYINGVYWGVFQSQERSEARYAETYLGGSKEEYDVIKPNISYPYNETGVEATDGSLNSWRDVWDLIADEFITNEKYFRLQGLNPDGSRNRNYQNLVDMKNLIDYMLIIFYTGNFDSPTNVWGDNRNAKNFFCIYNRIGFDGYKFFIHDAEHSLNTMPDAGPGTIGLYENRVNIGFTDERRMYISNFAMFNPQWLHFKLATNEEFRILMADRVYKFIFNNGALTPDKVTELFLSRAQEIEMAIISESARWGDAFHEPARTKNGDWQFAINDIVDNYFPYRTDIVLDQLQEVDWYPDFQPPVYLHNNSQILDDVIEKSNEINIEIKNPGASGLIYYTKNGEDPRAIGGGIATSAFQSNDPVEVTINSITTLKSRIKMGDKWSALHELLVLMPDDKSNLKITEIHYHPVGTATIDGDDFEFLELKNIGDYPVNLSACNFGDSGIYYTFPENTILNGGEFIVLVSDISKFYQRYNFRPFGEYKGHLSNSGERISLYTADNNMILSVFYQDMTPWPESADGVGYSLVPTEINPTGNLNDAANWRLSLYAHGSPGQDDTEEGYEQLMVDEIPEPLITENTTFFSVYPNPVNTTAIVNLTLQEPEQVKITLYNTLGYQVSILLYEQMPAGQQFIEINFEEFTAGLYLLTIETKDCREVKKLIIQ
jgi:hypothetical protein